MHLFAVVKALESLFFGYFESVWPTQKPNIFSFKNKSLQSSTKRAKQIPTTNTNLDLTKIDHVPSSGTHSGSNAMLYVFEDNEAVIKMIIKGRSPTMRHVSRTHRVALDWLSDSINLDSKIQIRYIDTKHQRADILTKGNLTRDEWNNLLHLLRWQKVFRNKKGGRVVYKSRPVMNVSSYLVATSSSAASSPISSKSPGISGASRKLERLKYD